MLAVVLILVRGIASCPACGTGGVARCSKCCCVCDASELAVWLRTAPHQYQHHPHWYCGSLGLSASPALVFPSPMRVLALALALALAQVNLQVNLQVLAPAK